VLEYKLHSTYGRGHTAPYQDQPAASNFHCNIPEPDCARSPRIPTNVDLPGAFAHSKKPWEPSNNAIRVQGDVWAKQASLRTQTILASLINVSSHVLLPRASQLYRGSVAEVLGRGAEGNPLYAGRAARAKATRCRPGGVGS
jgi:hypothetical protein